MRVKARLALIQQQALRWAPVSVRRRWWYLRVHHRWLHLHKPELFTEKLNWRIAKDRRAILAGTCDKLAMKVYAEEHCRDLPLRIPTTYWSGTELAELATVDLPERWVIKPNHRSDGMALLSTGKPDIADLRRRTKGWLDEWNWAVWGEWAYHDARRLLVVEERIGMGATPPVDYKVFVFGGQVRMVTLNHNRFAGMSLRYYTPEWEPMMYTNVLPLADAIPKPDELPLILDIAARLAEPFDFMRVDLYLDGGEVWFGELTPYSGGGLQIYNPPDLDATLGGYWELPSLTT